MPHDEEEFKSFLISLVIIIAVFYIGFLVVKAKYTISSPKTTHICSFPGRTDKKVINDCYIKETKRTTNKYYCDFVKDNNAKAACLAIANNNGNQCLEIDRNLVYGQDYYNDCLLHIASKMGKEHLCEHLTQISDKDYCYFIVAQNTYNVTICKKISDSQSKQDCEVQAV